MLSKHMIQYSFFLAISFFSLSFNTHATTSYSVESGGHQLRNTLDGMNVEDNWLDHACVTWQTGELISRDQRACSRLHLITLSHCSAFVAAVINYTFGYEFLTPDDYTFYTSNWQADWLANEGQAKGWHPIEFSQRKQVYIEGQKKANKGCLVVVSFKNPRWKPGASAKKLAGHIAIIRPSNRDEISLETTGPQITQSGLINYNSASLIKGFGSYEMPRTKFYWHASPYCQE